MDKDLEYRRKVLFANEVAEVVQIIWPPGSQSLPHDHGNSKGTIWVTRGCIFQEVFSKESKTFRHSVSCPTGTVIKESPDSIHIMGNCRGSEEAETIHVYSPPLKMTEYDPQELRY